MEMQEIDKEGGKTEEDVGASEPILEANTEGTRRQNQERLDIKNAKHMLKLWK